MAGYRHRYMLNVTGHPGWMRFGFSPGWQGVSPTGLPPAAEYLKQTGQMPQFTSFIQQQAPGDNKLVPESIKRIQNNYGPIKSYATDRGFDSPENSIDLEELGIINAMCPRSVKELESRLEDEDFCRLQTRRGATEARIGIFKNAYLGKPLKSKGFKNRRYRILWCILSHNLWKLGTMAAERRKEFEEESENIA